MKKMWMIVLMMVGVMLAVSGCRKPYDTPKFEEIGPKETGFVLQMEGNAEKQNSFASADLLKQRKVATRRIQIERRWVDTGRRGMFGIGTWHGEYMDTMQVIKVDRTPVTRLWSPDPNIGTSKKNQGLSAESNDSIGVISGFTITAWIAEEDAHMFLYRYQGVPLADVMDSQIFNSVQSIYSEVCNKYDLKELRGKKQEITDEIRKRVIPFYKQWGITIAEDCGLVGGLEYDDKEIQTAINNVFVAQQREKENEALLAAQSKENERLMTVAENKATMVGIEAKAEAGRIEEISKAIEKNADSYIKLQQLKLMQDFITNGLYVVDNEGKQKPVWDGKLPTIVNLGGSQGMGMLLETPANSLLPSGK